MKLFSRVLWIEWELMRGGFLFFLTNGKERETQVEVFFPPAAFSRKQRTEEEQENFQPLIYIGRRLFPLLLFLSFFGLGKCWVFGALGF